MLCIVDHDIGRVVGAGEEQRHPARWLIRRALALVLLASGLKLLGVTTTATAVVLVTCIILGPLAWMGARRRHGLPALRYQESVRVHRPELGEGTEATKK